MAKYFCLPLLVLPLLLIECSEQPTESTLYGIVTDFHTLEPIQGASIVFFENQVINASQTTGSDGRYNMRITKEIRGYSDFIRVFCMGYEPIETADLNLPLGDSKQLDFQLIPNKNEDGSGSGVLGAINVAFRNPTNYATESPYFTISNNSNAPITNIDVQIQYLGGGNNYWTITIPAYGSKTITSTYRVFWFDGDVVTITINGKSKTWKYSSQ